jgi:Flp pilus assembly protein protease CpaA
MHIMPIAEMIVAAWCLGVVFTDLRFRRIPNSLMVGAYLVAGLSLLITGHALMGPHWQSVILGVGVSLALTLPAYAARLLGAGDVKLILAIALIGGWYLTLFAFVIASILAITFVIANIIFTQFGTHQVPPKRWIPFGAALSAGLLSAIGVAV